MKNLAHLASIYLILFATIPSSLPHSSAESHYFADDKEPASPSETGNFLGQQPEYHECFIIVQETKKIGGQCVKIRDKIQGCVAGNLMHPFHHDCL